jgi:hypothetical protein
MAGSLDGRMDILSIAAYQLLADEGANGIRVAAWKHRTRVEHRTRVDGEVFVEYEIQETSAQMAAQKFQTVQARGAADYGITCGERPVSNATTKKITASEQIYDVRR